MIYVIGGLILGALAVVLYRRIRQRKRSALRKRIWMKKLQTLQRASEIFE